MKGHPDGCALDAIWWNLIHLEGFPFHSFKIYIIACMTYGVLESRLLWERLEQGRGEGSLRPTAMQDPFLQSSSRAAPAAGQYWEVFASHTIQPVWWWCHTENIVVLHNLSPPNAAVVKPVLFLAQFVGVWQWSGITSPQSSRHWGEPGCFQVWALCTHAP